MNELRFLEIVPAGLKSLKDRVESLVRDEEGTQYTVWIDTAPDRFGYRLWVRNSYYLIGEELRAEVGCSIRFGPPQSLNNPLKTIEIYREINGDHCRKILETETTTEQHPLGLIRRTMIPIFCSLGISAEFSQWLLPDFWSLFPKMRDQGVLLIESGSPIDCYLGRKSLEYAIMRLNVREPG